MSKTMIPDAHIAEAAFYMWLEEGKPAGRDQDHWLRAKTTLEAAQAKPKKRAATPKAKAAPKAAAKAAPKAAAAKAPAKRAPRKKAIDA